MRSARLKEYSSSVIGAPGPLLKSEYGSIESLMKIQKTIIPGSSGFLDLYESKSEYECIEYYQDGFPNNCLNVVPFPHNKFHLIESSLGSLIPPARIR